MHWSPSSSVDLSHVDEVLYLANVGDSRAVLSRKGGSSVIQLTVDHKPGSESESVRILAHNGTIYRVANLKNEPDPQMVIAMNSQEVLRLASLTQEPMVLYAGPIRVRPGGLSVSRTIGDIEAKSIKYGGKSGVVIPTPEVHSHRISTGDEFLIMASDGIFDGLSNEELVRSVYQSVKAEASLLVLPANQDDLKAAYETVLDAVVQALMRDSLLGKSEDNITVIMIIFPDFLEHIKHSFRVSL